jgi:hypothetical protein
VTPTPRDELAPPAGLTVTETVAAPGRRWSGREVFVIVLGLLVTVAGVIVLPPDRILGATIRLVFFHGGIVWTAIILSVAGAVLSVRELVRRPAAPARGELRPASESPVGSSGLLQRALWLATGFWLLTMAMSFPVMQLSWGGIRWDEARLWMTVEIVFLYLILFAFGVMIARPWVIAVAWLCVDVVMGVLLATTPGSFHPDNPVFRSGSVRYIGGFLAIVAGLQLVAFGLLFVRRVGEAPSLA